jgi:hypothetical protein
MPSRAESTIDQSTNAQQNLAQTPLTHNRLCTRRQIQSIGLWMARTEDTKRFGPTDSWFSKCLDSSQKLLQLSSSVRTIRIWVSQGFRRRSSFEMVDAFPCVFTDRSLILSDVQTWFMIKIN